MKFGLLNKKFFYFALTLLFLFLVFLYLKFVLHLEIKRGGIYPNGFYISTTRTTTKKISELTDQECRSYIKSLEIAMGKGDAKALTNLKRMAEEGIPYAQTVLAMLYVEGYIVEKDFAKAFDLYTSAVAKEEPGAQLNMGGLYEFGIHVEKDFHKAAEFYKLALENKNMSSKKLAQFNLANLYRQGLGVEKNIEKAIEMYKEVLKTEDGEVESEKAKMGALVALGHLYRRKNEFDTSRKYYMAAAEKGHPIASTELGYYYLLGNGVEKNIQKAIELFTFAAEKGEPIAQRNLGICYEQGVGVEKNIEKAIEMYKKVLKTEFDGVGESLEKAKISALVALGYLYRGKNEFDTARKYFIAAAEKGDLNASAELGYYYLVGEGVEKNIQKAIELFTFAAERGQPAAQNNLGICYFEGTGVKKNIPKAMELLEASAKQGNELAKGNLEKLKKEKSAQK